MHLAAESRAAIEAAPRGPDVEGPASCANNVGSLGFDLDRLVERRQWLADNYRSITSASISS
jgi:hypothetical protein